MSLIFNPQPGDMVAFHESPRRLLGIVVRVVRGKTTGTWFVHVAEVGVSDSFQNYSIWRDDELTEFIG
mgnify:CR=1 FL=1